MIKSTGENLVLYSKVEGSDSSNPDGSNREEVIRRSYLGEEVFLVRDQNNAYDPNTIMVCNLEGKLLGFLGKEIASQLSQMLDQAKEVEVNIIGITGGVPGMSYGCQLRIEVSSKPAISSTENSSGSSNSELQVLESLDVATPQELHLSETPIQGFNPITHSQQENGNIREPFVISEENCGFTFFFGKLGYLVDHSRGFSVYCSTDELVKLFQLQCDKHNLLIVTIRASEITRDYQLSPLPDNKQAFVIFVLDIGIELISLLIQQIVDRVIYPLWFRGISICLFSLLAKSDLLVDKIDSKMIHEEESKAIGLLFQEQLMSLTERVNFQFPLPEFLQLSPEEIQFTPIEEILKTALEKACISYEAQVRFRQFIVDFVVKIDDQKIIVECDGHDFHDPDRDTKRDHALKNEGFPIVHLTGSQIYRDPQDCIEIIKNQAVQARAQLFQIDPDLDESQKKALDELPGPIRVLAPAGSGKTKTLTNRIIHLINAGVSPGKILALAFNSKAAGEMTQRLHKKGIAIGVSNHLTM